MIDPTLPRGSEEKDGADVVSATVSSEELVIFAATFLLSTKDPSFRSVRSSPAFSDPAPFPSLATTALQCISSSVRTKSDATASTPSIYTTSSSSSFVDPLNGPDPTTTRTTSGVSPSPDAAGVDIKGERRPFRRAATERHRAARRTVSGASCPCPLPRVTTSRPPDKYSCRFAETSASTKSVAVLPPGRNIHREVIGTSLQSPVRPSADPPPNCQCADNAEEASRSNVRSSLPLEAAGQTTGSVQVCPFPLGDSGTYGFLAETRRSAVPWRAFPCAETRYLSTATAVEVDFPSAEDRFRDLDVSPFFLSSVNASYPIMAVTAASPTSPIRKRRSASAPGVGSGLPSRVATYLARPPGVAFPFFPTKTEAVFFGAAAAAAAIAGSDALAAAAAPMRAVETDGDSSRGVVASSATSIPSGVTAELFRAALISSARSRMGWLTPDTPTDGCSAAPFPPSEWGAPETSPPSSGHICRLGRRSLSPPDADGPPSSPTDDDGALMDAWTASKVMSLASTADGRASPAAACGPGSRLGARRSGRTPSLLRRWWSDIRGTASSKLVTLAAADSSDRTIRPPRRTGPERSSGTTSAGDGDGGGWAGRGGRYVRSTVVVAAEPETCIGPFPFFIRSPTSAAAAAAVLSSNGDIDAIIAGPGDPPTTVRGREATEYATEGRRRDNDDDDDDVVDPRRCSDPFDSSLSEPSFERWERTERPSAVPAANAAARRAAEALMAPQ
mmetsp:Transcript_54756/g.163751  ORF Transcript_54756/g.163751 Transcript_54756/m.163751 type:complete len:731 (+) Transcript_54756:967-3159(+)